MGFRQGGDRGFGRLNRRAFGPGFEAHERVGYRIAGAFARLVIGFALVFHVLLDGVQKVAAWAADVGQVAVGVDGADDRGEERFVAFDGERAVSARKRSTLRRVTW